LRGAKATREREKQKIEEELASSDWLAAAQRRSNQGEAAKRLLRGNRKPKLKGRRTRKDENETMLAATRKDDRGETKKKKAYTKMKEERNARTERAPWQEEPPERNV
jgi:hypothetical protein